MQASLRCFGLLALTLLSRVLEYKVNDTIYPISNWIKYIKEKGKKVDIGDKELSKEIKDKGEVNIVQNCPDIGKCGVSFKLLTQVGIGAASMLHARNFAYPKIPHFTGKLLQIKYIKTVD